MNKRTARSRQYSATKRDKKRSIPARHCIATWTNGRWRNKRFSNNNVTISLSMPVRLNWLVSGGGCRGIYGLHTRHPHLFFSKLQHLVAIVAA